MEIQRLPRCAGLAIPGISLHIIQRGNNRSACFYAKEDYRRYLATLHEMVAVF
jgi:putative transposase